MLICACGTSCHSLLPRCWPLAAANSSRLLNLRTSDHRKPLREGASSVRVRGELERLAARSIKRVFAADEDWAAPPGRRRMLAFTETKTVWHPVGIKPAAVPDPRVQPPGRRPGGVGRRTAACLD